jgi:putative peptidoglycan lipid II flippase
LEFSLLLTLPATIGLLVLAEPLVSLLFEGRAFPYTSVVATAHALQAFSIGLPAYVLIKIFSTTFFARHDSKTPVRAAVIAVSANILLNFLLIGALAHVGIALATSIASWVNAGWLFIKLRRAQAFAIDSLFSKRLGIILFTSLLLAGGLLIALYAFSDMLIYGPRARTPLLLGIIVGGGIFYIGLTYSLKAFDLQAFYRIPAISSRSQL